MVADLTGAGTPEDRWQAWQEPARWPELDLEAPPARVVVAAPHPDDEVLGVGMLLRRLADAGAEVRVVAASDGEASHPGSPTLDPSALAVRRDAERRAALTRLGLADVAVHRLRLPDGQVTAGPVADAVAAELSPGGWCLATWRGDGHPDHEAVGAAGARAAQAAGARLLEYPIWAWHWAAPADPRVPWSRARRVTGTDAEREAKLAAVGAYTSQIRPLSPHPADRAILPPPVLARLTRPAEVVFV